MLRVILQICQVCGDGVPRSRSLELMTHSADLGGGEPLATCRRAAVFVPRGTTEKEDGDG